MDLALCLFRVFPYGGLQHDFLKVAKKAIADGHKVTCYTMSWQGELLDGLELMLLPVKGFTNHAKCWYFAEVLKEKLSLAKHDKVLGFNRLPGLDFYFAGDLCFQAIAHEKHPILSRILPRYRTLIRLEEMVFNPASKTHILLLNPKQQAIYQKFYHTQTERFHLIPPGITLPTDQLSKTEARKKLNFSIPIDANWLLMVGRDLKSKGCDRNLQALAALPKALRAKTFLMVVGTNGLEKFKRIAKALKISPQVLFLGTRKEINTLMQASDILVHPAYWELAGMVLVEALVNGLPILTLDNCGYAFHVQSAEAGIVIPGQPFSQTIYNQSLIQMLESLPQAPWRENAHRYAATHDLSHMAEKILEILISSKIYHPAEVD